MAALQARITAWGACTPIGRDALSTAVAARAGFCGFREHPFMVDSAGEPMRVAQVPWLGIAVQGAQRLLQMLCPAIDEVLRGRESLPRVGLVLALPPPRPGLPQELVPALQEALKARHGQRLAVLQTVRSGHAAGIEALHQAAGLLQSGRVSACVVAGADSYLAPETLEWLEACDQLHGAGALNNAWGFVPGEGAGALLLQPPQAGAPAWADVVGLGLGRESRLIKTDAVCTGEGLTQAVRQALAALPEGLVATDIYCDMNGEAYRADEYGFTALRTRERLRNAGDFVTPADCWGDVGAAGAPLHLLLAAMACRKGHAKGPLALVWASSEGGERGAVLIRAPLAARP